MNIAAEPPLCDPARRGLRKVEEKEECSFFDAARDPQS